MPTFIASRISADHNVLFPDRIDIEEERIVYYKGAFGKRLLANMTKYTLLGI